MKRFKKGDTIFFKEVWSNLITSGEVIFLKKDPATDIEYYVVSANGSTIGCDITNAYESREACIEGEKRKSIDNVAAYKNDITDVASLLKFAITNAIGSAEEYTDYDARRAFVEKAKELCNVDLSEYC